ncbi:hypothetical protein CDD83_8737 [Cordyceps sp. RAO-2017]|nr:hypothetical protein CDD83_8737 [Cordyceps sp. RAO-2017]
MIVVRLPVIGLLPSRGAVACCCCVKPQLKVRPLRAIRISAAFRKRDAVLDPSAARLDPSSPGLRVGRSPGLDLPASARLSQRLASHACHVRRPSRPSSWPPAIFDCLAPASPSVSDPGLRGPCFAALPVIVSTIDPARRGALRVCRPCRPQGIGPTGLGLVGHVRRCLPFCRSFANHQPSASSPWFARAFSPPPPDVPRPGSRSC